MSFNPKLKTVICSNQVVLFWSVLLCVFCAYSQTSKFAVVTCSKFKEIGKNVDVDEICSNNPVSKACDQAIILDKNQKSVFDSCTARILEAQACEHLGWIWEKNSLGTYPWDGSCSNPYHLDEDDYNPDEDINPLVGKKADQDCLKMQDQIKNCTPLKENVNMFDFTNSGSSMESCKSLSKTAQNIRASTTRKIAKCNEEINRVISESEESSRCPDEAVRKKLHKKLHKILADLEQSGNDYYAMSDSFKGRADQCIAAFKKDLNPSLDPYPDSNPGQPPDTQTSQASRKTTNWSGLAQTAAQAFENLNGFGLEASIDGGELDSSSNAPNAASSPSFKQFNNNNGGLRESPYSRFNDEDGGGGFNGDGDPEDSIRNSQRTHGNKNPRNQASQAGLTAQRGHGGPSGANGGGFGSRNNGGGVSPSTNANQRGQARRRFASTKKRNLVLGYKRVKRGGSALTYHPTDLKKYGRDHVLTMARKAKKTFGEETPLLFENGEFIRDYLEMKNSLAWKKHNLRQRNRLSGIFKTKEEREKKAFHPCALVGECYTESRYNIFMLHHFAVIKFISDREE